MTLFSPNYVCPLVEGVKAEDHSGIKRYKPEEILQKTLQVNVLVGRGTVRIDAIFYIRNNRANMLPLAQAISGMSTNN